MQPQREPESPHKGTLTLGIVVVLGGLVFLYGAWSADQRQDVVHFKSSWTSPRWAYVGAGAIIALGLWAVLAECYRRWKP